MAQHLADLRQRRASSQHLRRDRVSQAVIVPTSAQASLCRPERYAELDEEVFARSDLCGVNVGITQLIVVILFGQASGEGGADDQAEE
jgi:hypothetical protein